MRLKAVREATVCPLSTVLFTFSAFEIDVVSVILLLQ